MSRARAALAKLCLASFSTLVSLVLAEGAYRVHLARSAKGADDTAWRDRIRSMNRTIYRRASDPALVYEPSPGAHVEMPYGDAGFNLASMRDDHEHSPDDRTRVAIVGDSIVWSEEVSLHDSLPRAVERALGAQRYEVLNFGVSGYDTAQEALWYERAVRPTRPSVVVVVYCMNDAMLMSGPYNRFATPEEAAHKDAQDALWEQLAPRRAETLEGLAQRRAAGASLRMLADLRTWAEVRRYERSAEYTDEYLLSHAQPDRAERVRASLTRMGAAIRADGARAVLVVSPVLRGWENYHWRAIHARVSHDGRDAGFEVRDPLDAWLSHERAEQLRLPGDSLHYGARGNERFGAFIAQAVQGGR